MNTIATIAAIIACGDIGRFVGMKEDQWFDAKRPPGYDLNTVAGRWELAKDVASFANAGGGFIVLGLETKVMLAERQEEVLATVSFAEAEFNKSQIVGVLSQYLHPKLKDVDVRWVEGHMTPGLGVGVIGIPEQPADGRFTLIAQVLDDGMPVKAIVFGLAVRQGSDSVPRTVDEMYRICRDGRTTQAERLIRMEAKLDHITRQVDRTDSSASGTRSEETQKRLERILDDD